jgi:hypothetical protein
MPLIRNVLNNMEQIYKLIQGLFEKHVGGTIAVTEFWPSLSCQLKKNGCSPCFIVILTHYD